MFVRGVLLLALLATPTSAQTVRSCRADRAEHAKVSAFWAQLRVALASADSAPAQGHETLAIHRFDRTLDREGRLRSETSMDARQYGTRPFRSASAEALSREGYVVFDSLGNAEFRAPDARVLLTREFAQDHCFESVKGSGINAGLIGLRFQPAAGRNVPDVEGVLWADAEPVVLRFMQFSYRAPLPSDASGVGGHMAFEHLPSGDWIVRDWVVRVPVMTQHQQLLGYREEGGETLVVSSAMLALLDSIDASRKPPGTISGVVIDSLTMRAFVRADVWVDSAGPRTTTDRVGTFWLRGVRPGFHAVGFSHPTLDSIGVRPRRVLVRVSPDSTSSVALGGPTLRTLRGDLCADSTSLLTGIIRDVATHAPVDSAEVSFSWVEIAFASNRLKSIDAKELVVYSTPSGRYAACVPPKLEVTGFARAGAARTGRVDTRTDDLRRLGILNFAIDRSATDTLTGSAVLHGIVKYQDATPLENATATLTDPEKSATSNAEGRFEITAIPGGTRVIDTRALGHAPVRNVIELRPGDTTTVTVYMRKVTMLDPVVVRAAAGDMSTRIFAELEERRRKGMGYRLSQTELLPFRNAQMDAVVRALPFTRVRYSPTGFRVTLLNSRGQDCTPTIWVDGRKWGVIDLDVISARDVLVAEVFTRHVQVPLKYQDFGDCGAILIWTRDAAAEK